MALDHYVSQVHLRHFYADELGERMYAARKNDLKRFTPRSQEVCRIEEGNTNDYLSEPRAVEEFLKTVERRYNPAVSTLESGEPDPEAIYVIAGFAAYLLICTPTAIRLNAGPLEGMASQLKQRAAVGDIVPKPPEVLGGKEFIEQLPAGELKVHVDPKIPQAIGVANILGRVAAFGNCTWNILKNEEPDCPFFTSDFPVASEPSSDPRVLNRVIPLTPWIAVRICPRLRRDPSTNFEFTEFAYTRRYVRRQEAIAINRLLVQSAEDKVFYCEDQEWTSRFIEKNRHFRVDTEVIKGAAGAPTQYRQSIAAFTRNPQPRSQRIA